MRWIWAAAGIICVGLGAVGLILPLVPTVPFLLLAAVCFARSSERLHNWLITHPQLGPPIMDWQQRGAIRRRAKVIATVSIVMVFAISVAFELRPMILIVQAAVLATVLIFIWSRREG